ncbi:hypothetical protein J3Q64DRAFT_1700261 [Phycomyces blakesleeanus]|uniref:Cas12f1-like TNB domain-containing protein n=2 Tax=Phycomyces blakesleeanus TaxID=4837 RepID=A0A162UVB6_PHYB8|nr:hypothetical protein PHYBLDRAFT_163389 [Phycomyces blakesleeanus NRRL 1555(-)]OAD78273.1 hypothetical protein PHYBLDRAFT_163389 [Phycomyces blakesleeanus NRRL 1555(-)]|eukprot:XP_018296313.1 hypothetical protein PHYBLDRAFT_163389 [Phycomyces blakesleeanus NRRL 1555(-)]
MTRSTTIITQIAVEIQSILKETKRGVSEICQRLLVGIQKCYQGSRIGIKTAPKEKVPFTTQMCPNTHSMKGKKAAPVKLIKKKIMQRLKNLVEVCFVDEYIISQVCNACKNRSLYNIAAAASKQKVHSVLRYSNTNCDIIWNRDVNAAKNMLD